MKIMSFKDFLVCEEGGSGLPNFARVGLGINPSDLQSAMKGAFPSSVAQIVIPTGKNNEIEVSSAPADFVLSKDGKKGKIKIMGDLSPYIFKNKMDLFKNKNINVNLSIEPDKLDQLMFQGIVKPPPAPGAVPPAAPPGGGISL